MEKVLLINGSPRGISSNTRKLAMAFLDGYCNEECSIEEIICSEKNINSCRGCMQCWKTVEGECVFDDDMKKIIKAYLEADFVIWSVPNFFYGMPSDAKKMLDRMLPILYQNLKTEDGQTTSHLRRFTEKKKKYLVFCSFGFYNSRDNVEAIKKHFELLYKKDCEFVFCPEGQLLGTKYLDYITNDYLKALKEEGASYRNSHKLSEKIRKQFEKPFLPIDEYIKMVDDVSVLHKKDSSDEDKKLVDADSFFKTMANTYIPNKLVSDNSVLEIELTDRSYTCQFQLSATSCKHVTDKNSFLPYRLRIVTGMDFFTTKRNMAGKAGNVSSKNDFEQLIDLVNKFEQRGIVKELRLN